MRYEDLFDRYGTHVAQRVRRDLTPSDFHAVELDDLPRWLEARADRAHEAYRQLLLVSPQDECEALRARIDEYCLHWKEAEDLAYIVTIAEDVSTHVRRARG